MRTRTSLGRLCGVSTDDGRLALALQLDVPISYRQLRLLDDTSLLYVFLHFPPSNQQPADLAALTLNPWRIHATLGGELL